MSESQDRREAYAQMRAEASRGDAAARITNQQRLIGPDGVQFPTIRELQAEIAEWITRNFGNDSPLATAGGLGEEGSEALEAALGLAELAGLQVTIGRVLRAAVKHDQGIRGTREEWVAELRKECADVFIKLTDVAQFYGFQLDEAVTERWALVQQRVNGERAAAEQEQPAHFPVTPMVNVSAEYLKALETVANSVRFASIPTGQRRLILGPLAGGVRS